MFVYLDHAQISALDLLLRRDPDAFSDFIAFWIEHNCRLVISRAHLHEIGQSEDERDVDQRLEMLRYFSLWSGEQNENVDWVIIREIRHQTLRRLDNATQASDARPYSPLREELYQRTDYSTLESFVRQNRPGWLQENRIRRTYAQSANRSLALRREFRRATSRKEAKWDPEGWRMLPLARLIMPAASGDPVADQWIREINTRAPECWKRARGKRQAMICMFELEGLSCLERAPEHDLNRLGFFRVLGKHWVEPYCRWAGHDPEAVRRALAEFDPYDAPAISASLAVERGRKQHEKDYKASDYMDVDHVLWAAHSDIAFVDKRTYGFLLQATKNPATARLLSPHLRVKFERTTTLDDVKRRIASADCNVTAEGFPTTEG